MWLLIKATRESASPTIAQVIFFIKSPGALGLITQDNCALNTRKLTPRCPFLLFLQMHLVVHEKDKQGSRLHDLTGSFQPCMFLIFLFLSTVKFFFFFSVCWNTFAKRWNGGVCHSPRPPHLT